MEIHSSGNSVGSRYLTNSTLVSEKYEANKGASFTQSAEINVIDDKQAQASSMVSISGRALMISRLFGSDAEEPPVLSSVRDNGEYTGVLPQHFLSEDDRVLISEMYELGYEEGVDLKHVDQLAKDLGRYRKYDDGKILFSFNEGSYDLQGRKQTVSFTEKDTDTAKSILSGSDLNSTRLDQGFIKWRLEPGYNFNRSSDLGFLEQMVTKFSINANDTTPLDPKFSTFAYNENNYIMHTADEVTLNIHRAPSNAEQDTSREALMAEAKALPQQLNQSLLEAFIGKNDEKPTERRAASSSKCNTIEACSG